VVHLGEGGEEGIVGIHFSPFPTSTHLRGRKAQVSSYQSENVVYGEAFAKAVLAAYKTTAANPLVNTAKVRLSTDPSLNPTPRSTIAELSAAEATFDGYPAGGVAVVLTTGLNLSTTAVGALCTALFECTGSTTDNSCYVYWIDDGTNVIMAEKFAAGASFGFGQAGDFLDLTAVLPMQLPQATV
jgi:hypothetical protein